MQYASATTLTDGGDFGKKEHDMNFERDAQATPLVQLVQRDDQPTDRTKTRRKAHDFNENSRKVNNYVSSEHLARPQQHYSTTQLIPQHEQQLQKPSFRGGDQTNASRQEAWVRGLRGGRAATNRTLAPHPLVRGLDQGLTRNRTVKKPGISQQKSTPQIYTSVQGNKTNVPSSFFLPSVFLPPKIKFDLIMDIRFYQLPFSSLCQ